MTHASHFYPRGTHLYFIFIGRMIALWMTDYLGEEQMAVLR